MNHLLRSLIRETLLLEEVYGAQAVVYHGTGANPQALIDALLQDKFTPGAGAGAMYGKGLYTVYDPDGAQTMAGGYGDHVIKLKVNLYGYIIFDPEIALKVYKRPLTPAEQAQEVGYNEGVIEALRSVKVPTDKFTSDSALKVHETLQHEVKGIVFTGRNDGRVAVVYDPTTAVPMAWKRVRSKSWTPVDMTALLTPIDRPDVSTREGRPVQQSALRRSAMGDFEAGKWDPVKRKLMILKGFERLPEDQRVVKGSLDLRDTGITSLPTGLKVGKDLYLTRTGITSLPTGLQVGGDLVLRDTGITSLPTGLQVGGDLVLRDTGITSLPTGLQVGGDLVLTGTRTTSLPADLKVGWTLWLNSTRITSLPTGLHHVKGDLNLRDTDITSLPAGLEVGGSLDLRGIKSIRALPDGLKVGGSLWLSETPITSLPTGLKVGGDLNLEGTGITSLPTGLKVDGGLTLSGTGITSLPADLKVGGYLNLYRTGITFLPSDIQVDGAIYGLNSKYWNNVPEYLKGKLR